MRVKYFPEMSELSLWLAWNDAIDAGEVPLEDKNKNQFLGIEGGYALKVSTDEKFGWSVKIVSEEDMRFQYAIDGDVENLTLKKAKIPYRLE